MTLSEKKLQFRLIDIGTVADYLLKQHKPIMEIELIRLFTEERFLSADRQKLYSLHFSVYNALYRLKHAAGKCGYYLHLEPMRIRMLKLPVTGCHHYDIEKGSYCAHTTSRDTYCSRHSETYKDYESQLIYDPLQDFYLNEENITFGASELLQKLMGGIVIYAFKKHEISQALQFFAITEPNKKTIQKKYYELAKIYHPDKNNGNDQKMRLLNKSYQVLKEVYVL